MIEELKDKNVELTLKHPKVEGGIQKYRTEDGWEMIVMLGRKEGQHYQMHRMVMAGSTLVAELITGFIKEFPDVVMPAIAKEMLESLKGHVGNMPNNKDDAPPGTKFN